MKYLQVSWDICLTREEKNKYWRTHKELSKQTEWHFSNMWYAFTVAVKALLMNFLCSDFELVLWFGSKEISCCEKIKENGKYGTYSLPKCVLSLSQQYAFSLYRFHQNTHLYLCVLF